MTLQTRLHNEVCLPAGLTACLCGAYARVGEEYAQGRVTGYVRGIDDFCALANRTQARLDAVWKQTVDLKQRIARLERERAEDRAAIRAAFAAIRDFATPKGAIWVHEHAAAIARATGQEGAR